MLIRRSEHFDGKTFNHIICSYCDLPIKSSETVVYYTKNRKSIDRTYFHDTIEKCLILIRKKK
jgi:hypothetical protein